MDSPPVTVVVMSHDRAVGEAVAAGFQRRGHAARFRHLYGVSGTVDGVLVLDVTDVETARTIDLSRFVGDQTVRVVVVGSVDWFGHSHAKPDATVAVTSSLGELVAAAMRAGSGNPTSSTPSAVRARTGRPVLTNRERQSLRELLAGHSTQQIADRWSVSEHTVRTHLQNAFGKIGVRSRAEAVAWALDAGLSPAQAQQEASA